MSRKNKKPEKVDPNYHQHVMKHGYVSTAFMLDDKSKALIMRSGESGMCMFCHMTNAEVKALGQFLIDHADDQWIEEAK